MPARRATEAKDTIWTPRQAERWVPVSRKVEGDGNEKMTKARKPGKGLTIGRARIVVNQWLLHMAQPEISTKLSHEDFPRELRKLIAPWRPDVGIGSR